MQKTDKMYCRKLRNKSFVKVTASVLTCIFVMFMYRYVTLRRTLEPGWAVLMFKVVCVFAILGLVVVAWADFLEGSMYNRMLKKKE